MTRYPQMHILFVFLWLSACTKLQPGGDGLIGSPTAPVRTPTRTLPPMIEFDYGDGGLISGVPCGPPCFMGIHTGDDLDAVSLALENLEIEPYCRWRTEVIQCPGFRVVLDLDGQAVWYVSFAPVEVRLSDLIEKYGEPDSVVIFTMVEINVPSQYHNLELCYPNMMVGLENQDSDYPYHATPDTKVQYVMYGDEPMCRTDYGIEWHGYGDYWE